MKHEKKKKKKGTPKQEPVSHKSEYLAMTLIAVLCLLVFGRNVTFEVFSLDLPKIIFDNPHIITGLTWENIRISFTQPTLALYQPLTNITFMLDSHLFGSWPGGYHLMTLLWHVACMCLFFWVMMRLIENFAVVFAATLLMAIHPVQILEVSQIGPRTEIMQAFFMLLGVDAYRRYAQKGSYKAYWLSVFFMGMGLLCKQTIVMLPAALLLLDYWPLNRIEISFRNFRNTLQAAFNLILEKAPWFALSLLGAWLAVYGKMQYTQLSYHVSKLTVPDAIYFVITGYARYLGHLAYPLRLAYFEVYSEEQTLGFFVLSAATLAVITAVALILIQRRPYIIVGWLWFIVFLFPVSGVVRYMMEAIALRYMYMPTMGIYIAVFMGIYELALRIRSKETATQEEKPASLYNQMPWWYWAGVGIVASVLAVLSFWQNGFFRDTETIVTHVQKITGDKSALGHNLLAVLRVQQGRPEDALEHFKRSVEIQPESHLFRFYYGGALYELGKYQEVVSVMEPAIRAVSDAPEYLELYSLGLMAIGRYSDAEKYLKNALDIEPDTISLLQNMAYCLILQGKLNEANPHLEKALKQEPENPGLLELKKMSSKVIDYSVN
jgi:tetratricopeptide (TPR) repeat protein